MKDFDFSANEVRVLAKLLERYGENGLKDVLAATAVSSKRIENLTSHEVTILDRENRVLEVIPPLRTAETAARAEVDPQYDFSIGSVPIYRQCGNGTVDLPPKRDGVYLIVSAQTASFCDASRDDLLCVYKTVRTPDGAILGCRGLILS